jgi:hypothetical protein
MADPIRRISPNPPARRWGWKTRQIVDCIRDLVAIGEVFSYAMCLDLCGIDLQREEHLRESVKLLALDYDIVLEAVPGVGYQRLSEPAKVDKGDSDFQRIYRKARRIQAEQATVEVLQLSDLDRHRYLSQQTLAGCLTLWTDPRVRRALPQAPEPPALPVPFDFAAHKDLFTRKQTS